MSREDSHSGVWNKIRFGPFLQARHRIGSQWCSLFGRFCTHRRELPGIQCSVNGSADENREYQHHKIHAYTEKEGLQGADDELPSGVSHWIWIYVFNRIG
jgi:hypothetical protein